LKHRTQIEPEPARPAIRRIGGDLNRDPIPFALTVTLTFHLS
jgi:hypothetical protein